MLLLVGAASTITVYIRLKLQIKLQRTILSVRETHFNGQFLHVNELLSIAQQLRVSTD